MIYSPTKPGISTRIDWSDPLSQGLVGCWLFNEGGGLPYDLVSGQQGTVEGVAITVSTLGLTTLGAGTNYYTSINIDLPITLISLSIATTTGGSALIGIGDGTSSKGLLLNRLVTTGALQCIFPGVGTRTFTGLDVAGVGQKCFFACTKTRGSTSPIGYSSINGSALKTDGTQAAAIMATPCTRIYGVGGRTVLLSARTTHILSMIYNRILSASEIHQLRELTAGW